MSVFLLLPFFPISASGVRFFKGTRKWKRVLEQSLTYVGGGTWKPEIEEEERSWKKRNNKQTAVEEELGQIPRSRVYNRFGFGWVRVGGEVW
jgi:hypothetical protein